MPPKVKASLRAAHVNNLRQPEVRALCIGLGMPVMQSWRATPKELQEWLIQRAALFVEKNLERAGIDWSLFRAPAKQYCFDLQAYLSGDGPAPVFCAELADEPSVEVVAYEEPEVWARSEEEAEEDTDEEIAEEEAAKRVVTTAAETQPEVVPVQPEPKEQVTMSDQPSRFKKRAPGAAVKAAEIRRDAEENATQAAEAAPAKEEEKVPEKAPAAAAKNPVENAPLPAVRAITPDADVAANVQKVADLVERLCQVVSRQQEAIDALVGKVNAISVENVSRKDAVNSLREEMEPMREALDTLQLGVADAQKGVLFLINSLCLEADAELVKSFEEVPTPDEM